MDKKNNNIVSHFLTIGLGVFINMFLGLISTPIITRIVDPVEYGQFSIFTMYTGIAVIVLCIGLDQALIRFYHNKEDILYKKSLLKLCISLPIIVSAICSFFVIGLSLSGIIVFEFSNVIVVLLCINVMLNIWSRIAVLLLRITYQSKKYAKANIIIKIVYIVVALYLLWFSNVDSVFALCIATVCSFFIQAIYSTLSAKEMWNFSKENHLTNKVEVIKYGFPFILSMGITTIFQAMDKISLNRFCSFYEVGIYASAISLINIFAIVQSTFNSLWGPLQVEHYVKNPEDKSFIKKGNSFITIIMFFLGFSLIFVKDIFVVLLGEKYRVAAYILPFLVFNPIMYTISETTCSGIGVSKKSFLNIWVSLGACITNIIGNTILVPLIGGQGAAISTGISYIVFFALRTFFSNKYYYVDYSIYKIIIITIMALIYAGYNTFYEFSIISIMGYCLCLSTLFVLYKNELFEMFIITKKMLIKR